MVGIGYVSLRARIWPIGLEWSETEDEGARSRLQLDQALVSRDIHGHSVNLTDESLHAVDTPRPVAPQQRVRSIGCLNENG